MASPGDTSAAGFADAWARETERAEHGAARPGFGAGRDTPESHPSFAGTVASFAGTVAAAGGTATTALGSIGGIGDTLESLGDNASSIAMWGGIAVVALAILVVALVAAYVLSPVIGALRRA